MKNGHAISEPSFLDAHGPKVGIAMCFLSACMVVALSIWIATCFLPGIVEGLR